MWIGKWSIWVAAHNWGFIVIHPSIALRLITITSMEHLPLYFSLSERSPTSPESYPSRVGDTLEISTSFSDRHLHVHLTNSFLERRRGDAPPIKRSIQEGIILFVPREVWQNLKAREHSKLVPDTIHKNKTAPKRRICYARTYKFWHNKNIPSWMPQALVNTTFEISSLQQYQTELNSRLILVYTWTSGAAFKPQVDSRRPSQRALIRDMASGKTAARALRTEEATQGCPALRGRAFLLVSAQLFACSSQLWVQPFVLCPLKPRPELHNGSLWCSDHVRRRVNW